MTSPRKKPKLVPQKPRPLTTYAAAAAALAALAALALRWRRPASISTCNCLGELPGPQLGDLLEHAGRPLAAQRAYNQDEAAAKRHNSCGGAATALVSPRPLGARALLSRPGADFASTLLVRRREKMLGMWSFRIQKNHGTVVVHEPASGFRHAKWARGDAVPPKRSTRLAAGRTSSCTTSRYTGSRSRSSRATHSLLPQLRAGQPLRSLPTSTSPPRLTRIRTRSSSCSCSPSAGWCTRRARRSRPGPAARQAGRRAARRRRGADGPAVVNATLRRRRPTCSRLLPHGRRRSATAAASRRRRSPFRSSRRTCTPRGSSSSARPSMRACAGAPCSGRRRQPGGAIGGGCARRSRVAARAAAARRRPREQRQRGVGGVAVPRLALLADALGRRRRRP